MIKCQTMGGGHIQAKKQKLDARGATQPPSLYYCR